MKVICCNFLQRAVFEIHHAFLSNDEEAFFVCQPAVNKKDLIDGRFEREGRSMSNARPWLFVYMIPFLLLSFVAVKSDISNDYHPAYISFAALCYALMGIGIVLHASGICNSLIRGIWKFLFPLLTAFYLASFFVDFSFGNNAHSMHYGLLSYGFVLVLGIVLFLPALWSAFSLAYGD